MNDPVKAREALFDFSTVLQTHRLRFREVVESTDQSYEILNNELEGSVAEDIYRSWKLIKDRIDEYLKAATLVELKVRNQADQLGLF